MTNRLIQQRGNQPDWLLISLYIVITSIGWLMIYSASVGTDDVALFDMSRVHGRQFLWMGVSALCILTTLVIPYTFWRNFSFLFYFLALLVLVLVLILGNEVKGARSWFSFGPFSFQPTEFAKFATILAVSFYTASSRFKIGQIRSLATAIGLFMLPSALILLQPDAGSSLIFLSFFILLYRLGLWAGYYIIILSMILLFISSVIYGSIAVVSVITALGAIISFANLNKSARVYTLLTSLSLLTLMAIAFYYGRPMWALYISALALVLCLGHGVVRNEWRTVGITAGLIFIGSVFAFSTDLLIHRVLEPHQQERINVWLQPSKCDPRGSLYNVIQSKVAIGSGGLTGKGFNQGSMTRFNFIPEQSTDFIFCTVGEEQGFVGVVVLLLLYASFIGRLLISAENSRKNYTRNYGYAFAGVLFFHFVINIGMTMGLVPIIGIPLPFLSYGGSSLIFFSLALGVYLRLKLDDF